MPLKLITLLTVSFISLFFISCNGGKMEEPKISHRAIKDISAAEWKKFSQKMIYFGHKSVGLNIIDGIKDLTIENHKLNINIIETADPVDFKEGAFFHSRIGKNVDPRSKISEFNHVIENGIGLKADIAFFKFCYVDINENTNVKDVFNEYKDTMETLRKKYPNVSFVHVTVPLCTTTTTWKTWIKKLIGKQYIWEYEDNIKRNIFNALLIKEYEDQVSIFDLAKSESTLPDGSRATFKRNGKTYYSLASVYTDDGGHLNSMGRKRVAEDLLLYLLNLK